MPEKKQKKSSWSRIAGVSTLVSAAGLIISLFWQAEAVGLLLFLFVTGAVAGWFARRHGWLSGIIVGVPVAVLQLTRLALHDYGALSVLLAQPDYWRLVVPASVASTGMAIIGGITGAWWQDMKLQKGS